MNTRRRFAASALLLLLAATPRLAAAKSAGPPEIDACRPGAPSKACAEAKTRFLADGGEGGGCPHCAAALKATAAEGDIPAPRKLF